MASDDFVAGHRMDLRKVDLSKKMEGGEIVLKLGQGEHFDEKKGGNLVISMTFVPN